MCSMVDANRVQGRCRPAENRPRHARRKDSAEGTLSVADALRVFSIRTLVAAKQNVVNTEIVNRIVRERTSNFLSTDFLL